jgi:hypothetical protein
METLPLLSTKKEILAPKLNLLILHRQIKRIFEKIIDICFAAYDSQENDPRNKRQTSLL